MTFEEAKRKAKFGHSDWITYVAMGSSEDDEPTEADARRAKRIFDLIEGTQAAEYGQIEEFQTEPAQFLVVEYGCGDPLCAMAAVTLSEAAEQIDQSETMRDSVTVYDLDTKDEWTPVFETVKFFRSKGTDGEHRVTPAR